MKTDKQYVYVGYPRTAELVAVGSIEAAKQYIVEQFPGAHFGKWQRTPVGRTLPAWRNAGDELRCQLGETAEQHRPVRYVCLLPFRVPVPDTQKAGERED